MSPDDALIEQLAALVGIAPVYVDAFGQPVLVSLESRRAVLAGLGLGLGSHEEVEASLARVAEIRRGLVPALVPAEAGVATEVPVRSGSGRADGSWTLVAEDGTARHGAVEGDRISLPPLAPGYYQLSAEVGGRTGAGTLIAAPRRCWEPEELRDPETRLWGLTAQVYGLRSERNFGIGDYTDVLQAAEGAGTLGASFLGLSPVHALFAADRSKISPYSPSSRLFLESSFIDPTAVPGFAGSTAANLLEDTDLGERAAALRDASLVDLAAVWAVKRPLLDALWADFRGRGDPGFEAFRLEGGSALEGHAVFETLHEHFWNQGRWWLGDWPPEFQDVRSEKVRALAAENEERVAFHAWLQWLADRQLGRAQARARASGMGIGLYRDLAVGADRGGSEIWGAPDRFAATLSVGAPPDILGPQGQNWGLPPFDPLALELQGLAAFRALVTANMRHAGAIRIDHAFQLQRLFLIPPGATPAEGAYVDFPFEALLAVLRLESHRARCLVIAEDLGTAPEGFSGAIMASGVLSYRILSFEREADGTFKRPETYPRWALAAINTHDLPTFRGWWRGLDIDLRQTFGVADAETAELDRAGRAAERRQLAEALAAEGLLPSPEPPEEPPIEGALRYLARTPSCLLAVQLEDASGEINQANMPGLDQYHPNWKRRLSTDIGAIVAPGGDLAKLAVSLATEGRGVRRSRNALATPPPRATYRVQFHKDFTFDDAVAIVPYLARLGVSHLYASPIHTARPGSTHGYDIVDHTAINPELGGEEGFGRLSEALREHGLGLLLDTVPNHMGVGGSDNRWWLSTLEWGELSPHSQAFDIDWERLGAHHKLVVPFLGDRYGEALEKGDLKLAFDAAEGSFSIWHYEHRFPISPLTYPIVIDRALAVLGDITDPAHAEALAISDRLRAMATETAPERRAAFPEEADELKARLARAAAASSDLTEGVERAVALVNGAPGLPESFSTLHRILEDQPYRLAHWRVAASDINYRRFFDINSLAGIRVELADVFDETHAMIAGLVQAGRIDGLRIDHIDGLADPDGYAHALQSLVGPGFYVVVEKILEPGEALRPWPIAGTTGYDVLNLIDGIQVEGANAGAFERFYRDTTGIEGSYGELLRRAKTDTLVRSFASELEVLVSDLKRIADADRRTRDYTVYSMRIALIEIIGRFPVYRSYITAAPDEADRELIESTVERAKRRSALPDRSLHDFVAAALLGTVETEGPGRPAPEHVNRFRRRFQQLTGPVMAKSLEDTLFYRYVRLLSLNEVGGDPGHFGVEPEVFHRENAARAEAWPNGLIASTTHDTKRGEDARARLNALSELPEWWAEALAAWSDIAQPFLGSADGAEAPDANDRYLVLQTLLGAWPLELLDGDDGEAVAAFRGRIEGAVTKALREAKRHTSWVNVNDPYEAAALAFVRPLLEPGSAFLERFRPLARRLAYRGMLNGLSRTVLKCTLPGVPDIYQGTEFWDFSLVDPDNRRPVDYAARAQGLDRHDDLGSLLLNWRDGRLKQRILARLLADRGAAPVLYARGDYLPLEASGERAGQILAFSRQAGGEELIVAVPRLIGRALDNEEGAPLGPFWDDTSLRVPPGLWRDALTGTAVRADGGGTRIAELFATLPISVLRATR